MKKQTVLLPLFAVIVVTSAGLTEAACLFNFWNKKEDPCPFGGAGGISPLTTWLDMSPIKDVAKNEADLGNYKFDFSNDVFPMFGFMGYGGSRCGVKVGGGGWFGYKKIISAPRHVPQTDSLSLAINKGDTARVDSMAHLHTMLAYGGFLIEKNFPIGNATFEIGGLFGGGALILGKKLIAKNKTSAFFSTGDPDSPDSLENWTAAPLTCMDLHTGVSYKLSRFMVVGIDANVLMLHSESGFNFATESFLTFNPGIRLRILFGDLG